MTLQSVDKFFCAYCDFYGTDNEVLAHAQKEHREKISRPLVGHSSVQAAATDDIYERTNRAQVAEEAFKSAVAPSGEQRSSLPESTVTGFIDETLTRLGSCITDESERAVIGTLINVVEMEATASLRSQLEEAKREREALVGIARDAAWETGLWPYLRMNPPMSFEELRGHLKKSLVAKNEGLQQLEAADQSLSTLQSRVVEECAKIAEDYQRICNDEESGNHAKAAAQFIANRIRSKYPSGAKQ